MYGSSPELEKSLLNRLRSVTIEAAHPLILPGILAELELRRHTQLVESSINEVEARIFELNFQSNKARDMLRKEVEARNQLKRTSWLDLSYLRNSIETWRTQLQNMTYVAITHEEADLQTRRSLLSTDDESHVHQLVHQLRDSKMIEGRDAQHEQDKSALNQDVSQFSSKWTHADDQDHKEEMRWVGAKIKNRLTAILDNYDEKIRDCTMRLDGMVMATQWVTDPSYFTEPV
jgi:hypothetical protein